MATPVPTHPDDTHQRVVLVALLARTRRLHGHTVTTFAALAGVTPDAVSAFELQPTPNPGVRNAMGIARRTGHRLLLEPVGLPKTEPTAAVETYERLSHHPDPGRVDDAHATHVWETIVEVRRQHGVGQRALAEHLGCGQTAITQAEARAYPALVGTWQRYVRGLGDILGVQAHLDMRLEET